MLGVVQFVLGALGAFAGPPVADLPEVVRLETPAIAAHGESAAFLMVTRGPGRGVRWNVVWAERDRSTEESTTFRRASVLRLPGAPADGSAVDAVHEGPLALSGDGRLLAFHGHVRDARSGGTSSGLVVARIVDRPGEPGTFAHRAICIRTESVGEAVDDCSKLTFAPEGPRLFVLGTKHVLAIELAIDVAGELVAGPIEIVDRADDGTPADVGPRSGCFHGPVHCDAAGRFVVYTSAATNLDPRRRSRGVATWVSDLDPKRTGELEPANRRTVLVSLDRHGAFLEDTEYAPRISADGRWVVVGSTAALTEDRVVGGRATPSSSKFVEFLLYDLDPDRDGVIGNTELRPRLWRSLIARGRHLTCTRATSRGWLVTRFAGSRRASFGILGLARDEETASWELLLDHGAWPSASDNAASFDGRWVVGCEDRDLALRESLADYLRLRRVP